MGRRILDPLLPDRGDRGPPISDKRRMVNGILWVLRTGAPWRDMPERYGNWNSVFDRRTISEELLCTEFHVPVSFRVCCAHQLERIVQARHQTPVEKGGSRHRRLGGEPIAHGK